ncbi:hypothetical protein AB0C29_38190, partial [Actinoplanes sp. NPDC048791]|uniref:hypothetical protein n=1 Tax=Actinoplanes sp. NPDC048791 TaxID=3154623 RepID=UPI0033D27290
AAPRSANPRPAKPPELATTPTTAPRWLSRDAAAQHVVLRTERAAKALPGGLKEAMARQYGTSPVRRLG